MQKVKTNSTNFPCRGFLDATEVVVVVPCNYWNKSARPIVPPEFIRPGPPQANNKPWTTLLENEMPTTNVCVCVWPGVKSEIKWILNGTLN